jgi:hypothetical protein
MESLHFLERTAVTGIQNGEIRAEAQYPAQHTGLCERNWQSLLVWSRAKAERYSNVSGLH